MLAKLKARNDMIQCVPVRGGAGPVKVVYHMMLIAQLTNSTN